MTCAVCATAAGIMIAVAVVPRHTDLHAQSPDAPAGQSATRLGDGRWLTTGGESGSGVVASAAIVDLVAQTTTPLLASLVDARAWHSATLLSTGQVLIVGGIGSNGQVLGTAELFDPGTETFTRASLSNPEPRAHHTATLLTDGRVLIAGGVADNGRLTALAQIWSVEAQSNRRRVRCRASKDLSSRVTAGGWRCVHQRGNRCERAGGDGRRHVHPGDREDRPVVVLHQDPDGPPTIAYEHPVDGSADIPVDAFVTLRFSRALTLRASAIDPSYCPVRVVRSALASSPRRTARLVFVRPFDTLEPSTTYTLSFANVVDRTGVR